MARQTGSGRIGVHEILRGKVIERRVLIDDDPEVHLARAIETDHPIRRSWDMDATLQFTLRNIARWRHDTAKVREQVTQEIQELREDMKVECDEWKNGLTHEVRSGCADDPVCAPLLRSLLKKFGYTDNFTNGFMLIGKLKEGVGWPSKPDVAAPLPYHVLFLLFLMAVFVRGEPEERIRGKGKVGGVTSSQ